MYCALPYSTDDPIAKPEQTSTAGGLCWGLTYGHLYLSDNSGVSWWREGIIDLYSTAIEAQPDSSVLFWDLQHNCYRYSLRDHIMAAYVPAAPLAGFLKVPVRSIQIFAGTSGCFNSSGCEVNYRKGRAPGILQTKGSTSGGWEVQAWPHDIKQAQLSAVLRAINADAGFVPAIKDFKISEHDKHEYLAKVDSICAELIAKDEYMSRTGEPRKYTVNQKAARKSQIKELQGRYNDVLNRLDTISKPVIKAILDQGDGLSTTSYSFEIELVNINGDTLQLRRIYYETSKPWHLPWVIRYHGRILNCYSLEFSKFIKGCVPQEFIYSDKLSNDNLIMTIADYLLEDERLR